MAPDTPLGGGPTGEATDERARALALLPPGLAERSLSAHEIALLPDDAEQALRALSAGGHTVSAWEGWVRWPSGARARSLQHTGSFALPGDPHRAADTAIAGIRRAAERWERRPEYPDTVLFFTIEVATR